MYCYLRASLFTSPDVVKRDTRINGSQYFVIYTYASASNKQSRRMEKGGELRKGNGDLKSGKMEAILVY